MGFEVGSIESAMELQRRDGLCQGEEHLHLCVQDEATMGQKDD